MTRVALALAFLIGCREERAAAPPTPLTPSSEAVASRETTTTNVSDELPPSLYAKGEPDKAKKKAARAERVDGDDKRVDVDDKRADDPRAELPPPLLADPPAAPAEPLPPPPPPAPPSDELPPPLLQEPVAVDKTDKIKPHDDRATEKKEEREDRKEARREARRTIAAVKSALCVTTGVAKIGGKIEKPAMRAVAKGTEGEAAQLTFTYHGETPTQKKLASGEVRRQLGLKLRAENGCNLIYVMWRLDPKPMVYVQTKRNPGAKDHKDCGAGGYKKVKAAEEKAPPELVFGEKHTLRAEIENEELKVFIDDTLHWRGTLPENVKDLRGPAGLRSDNLAFDLVELAAPSTDLARGNAKCLPEDND